LELGLWDGKYDGLERQWLRWRDVNGQWLPTLAERAEQERQRADKLAAKLRALGFDPEEL